MCFNDNTELSAMFIFEETATHVRKRRKNGETEKMTSATFSADASWIGQHSLIDV